jgi:hypothetical protein
MRRYKTSASLLMFAACVLSGYSAHAADTNTSDGQRMLMAAADTTTHKKSHPKSKNVPPQAQPAPAPPTGQNAFIKALTEGTPLLDMRYRYENVQQDGLAHTDGFANTVRTRVGYETGIFDDFKARVQIQNLMPIGGDSHYNNGVNGMTTFPTIADPREMVGLYEASLSWQGLPQSTVTVGRQALALDNERWIGISDWRQLGQTMDGFTAQNHSVDNLNLSYSYVFHVNRIFGPTAGSGANNSYDTSINLLNANYTGIPGVKLIAYDYLLDLLNANTLSSQTIGGRVEVKREVFEKTNLLFNGEYARQMSYGNNAVRFGYNYYIVEPGVNYGPITAKIALESMGGDGNHALQAPLDTGHAFNGWAEKFLTTPVTGLDNAHVTAEYKSPDHNEWLNATVVKGVWYDFTADSSSQHYGNEYDLWIGQTFFKHYTLGLEYADYVADKLLTNTHKYVVQLQIKY